MRSLLLLFGACLLLAGCYGPPSTEELSRLDYGAPPTDYEEAIKAYFYLRLTDPYTAVYEFMTPPRKGWIRVGDTFNQTLFGGYIATATVNSKNLYGGYAGRQGWAIYFRNGKIELAAPMELQGSRWGFAESGTDH